MAAGGRCEGMQAIGDCRLEILQIGYQICTTTSKFSYLQNFVVVSSTASAQIFVQVVKSRH